MLNSAKKILNCIQHDDSEMRLERGEGRGDDVAEGGGDSGRVWVEGMMFVCGVGDGAWAVFRRL